MKHHSSDYPMYPMTPKYAPVVRTAAIEILLGGKVADVAKTHGVRYQTCREYLHRYCIAVNRAAYETLAIEAVTYGCSTPHTSTLQLNKHLFIGERPSRTRAEAERDLARVVADLEDIQVRWCIAKCARAQLATEYETLKNESAKPSSSRVRFLRSFPPEKCAIAQSVNSAKVSGGKA